MKNKKLLIILIFIFLFFVLLFCNKTYAYTSEEIYSMNSGEVEQNHIPFVDYYIAYKEFEHYNYPDPYYIVFSFPDDDYYYAYIYNGSCTYYEEERDSQIICHFCSSSDFYRFFVLNSDLTIRTVGSKSEYKLDYPYPKGLFNLEYTSQDIYDANNIYDVVFPKRRCGATSGNNPSTGGNETEGGTSKDTERSDFFSSVGNWFSNLLSGITQGFENVISTFTSLLDYLNPFSDNFILKTIIEFLINILSYLNPFSDNFLGKKIVELLKEVLIFIFVPDEEEINNLISSVRNKFSFVDTIKNQISYLQDFLLNIDSSDNITMTLSNKYWSGTVTVLDFSWFSQYKEYTDIVITAFIYIFYLWRLFISLPGIISGISGSVSPHEQIDDIVAFQKFGFGRRNSNKQVTYKR